MKKILVIQTAFPGDAILTLPMIQRISEVYKKVKIDVIAIPATESIFSSSPFVNEVIVLDKKNAHKSIWSLIKFGKNLRDTYDKIISPHRSLRSSLLVYLTKVKDTVGYNTASLKSVYKRKVFYDNNSHEVKRLLSLLDVETPDWKILPITKVDINNKKLIEIIDRSKTENFVAVSPGSVWETKKYPEKYFLELAKSIINKGYTVLFTGGSGEQDLCDTLTKNAGKGAEAIAGALSIPESIEMFRCCSLVISNDSAPTHMALAANTQVFTIYCSTIPEFGFYPYSEKSKFISDNSLKCKPCGIHGHKVCPEKHFKCGYDLTPDKVFLEIEKLL